jgi:hypothetical protein
MHRLIIFLILAGVFGCSKDVAVINTANAQAASTPGISAHLEDVHHESPVKPLGGFMNVKAHGEHESGYLVELWKQDNNIYGMISGGNDMRLAGDAPAGILENIIFDPVSTRLSFRAKLSLGFFGVTDVPTRDTYNFEGLLGNSKLNGTITSTNDLCEDKCLRKRNITLKRSQEWTSTMTTFQTYAEWEAYANEILKLRGPKW